MSEKTNASPPTIPAQSEDRIAPPSKPTEREKKPPSPEEVAERVYHLFCQELRRERERRGHW